MFDYTFKKACALRENDACRYSDTAVVAVDLDAYLQLIFIVQLNLLDTKPIIEFEAFGWCLTAIVLKIEKERKDR